MLNSKLLGGTAAGKTYIEDVFSTWLYTGTGATQTITNGIDLSGKGGMVWIKSRSNAATSHALFDTARGATKQLSSNATSAETTTATGGTSYNLTGFNNTGFSLGGDWDTFVNGLTWTYASWTFRKAAKFFDVVTYTGTGSTRTVAHNLGSVPGCIIVKRTDTTGSWGVRHRSLADGQGLYLNLTNAASTAAGLWTTTPPTSTEFSLGAAGDVNASGGTYVAYLFAHDTGTDGLIQCGTSTSGTFNNLGWEPQWVLAKPTTNDSWYIYDNMRGLPASGTTPYLNTDLSNAEANGTNNVTVTATGFTQNLGNCVWIAIRRGPMRTPTDATKVFTALAATGSTNTSRTVGFPADLSFTRWRSGATAMQAVDRLRGMPTSSNANALLTSSTAAEAGTSPYAYDIWNTTAKDGSNANLNDMVWQYFRRAPGFFDAVAYTGTYTGSTGSPLNVSHSLGVSPELMIIKKRSSTGQWAVYSSTLGNTKHLQLNSTSAEATFSAYWNSTSPTTSQFTVGADGDVNLSAATYIAYLFATCPGVSKVGSYTGSGTTKQIDCGFTAGARFVLIKRTDSTGDWYVWDTARGIVSGNDPYLLLNSTAAEVTNTDYIDPLNSGFEISSTAPAAINANGGSYIYFSVA